MESVLRERLLVTGEMAEKFFPKGFCEEVLDLVALLPKAEAASVLETYDFFLQTQARYQAVAHDVYLTLAAHLRGTPTPTGPWRLQYLVEAARTPYEEEYVEPLRRALSNVKLKPSSQQTEEDLKELMESVTGLLFVMQDSPGYPSERALKYYQMIYLAGNLRTLSAPSILRRVTLHAERLMGEHVVLKRQNFRVPRGYSDTDLERASL